MKTHVHHKIISSHHAPSIAAVDDRSRVTNVTSYNATSSGTVLNEVKYTRAEGVKRGRS